MGTEGGMKTWVVSCGRCPYRMRLQTQREAREDMARHAAEKPDHNPMVTDEEQRCPLPAPESAGCPVHRDLHPQRDTTPLAQKGGGPTISHPWRSATCVNSRSSTDPIGRCTNSSNSFPALAGV